MTNSPYTIVINGHQVLCESASSVVALIRATAGSAAPAAAPAAKPAAAPKAAPKKRGGRKGKKAASPAAAAPAAPSAAPKKRARRAKRAASAPKANGLSKRSVSFLNEFARSGGVVMTADRLARATGAKGPKGVGGSLTSLARELKAYGYSIDSLISRKKTLEDGTTWSALPGCDRLVSEILAKIPQVG